MFTRLVVFGNVVFWVTGVCEVVQHLPGLTVSAPVDDPLYKEQRLVSTRVKREKVTVALIDGGVNADHEDLVANVIKGYNVITHDDDTYDVDGHGTKMAGVRGATLNNSIGLAGVADLVNIMPISYGDSPSLKAATAAIDYVIRRRNIKIILFANSASETTRDFDAKVKEADAAGILMVVAAGNDGRDITVNKRFPCSLTTHLKGMLCVTATIGSSMRLDPRANFANYEDIAAPGVNILTTTITGGYGYATGC
ncbi:hypothetical protein FOL47_003041 [Perkinsus chesapeaki]|uniref:subtilisin n=1 Tax=Perkinsus chesapeaki TaxID=330153 RepID=A0A7J6MA64_PERCH|nr:hypothetical protein FOL47_003041 [Perkinsus chesapeaki]